MSDPAARRTFGPNDWLVDEMYEQYRADPSSVSESWRDFFADYQRPGGNGPSPTTDQQRTEEAPEAPAAPKPAKPAPTDGAAKAKADKKESQPEPRAKKSGEDSGEAAPAAEAVILKGAAASIAK